MTDDRAGQASALNNVGWCHALLGNYQQAREFSQQALALHHDLGNRYGEAHAWDSLGYAEHHLGRLNEATASYQNALVIIRELGDHYYQADTLTHLGDTRHASGDPQGGSGCLAASPGHPHRPWPPRRGPGSRETTATQPE